MEFPERNKGLCLAVITLHLLPAQLQYVVYTVAFATVKGKVVLVLN
jgi:hypothetical protein